MAARVLLQRHAAPLTASLLAGGVAFYPRVAQAEAPESYKPSPKKPIYDDLDSLPTSATLPPARPASKDVSSPSSSSSSSATLVPEQSTTASSVSQAIAQYTKTAANNHHHHGPTPTDRLAVYVRDARLFLYRQACGAEDAVNRTMDRAFGLEKSFTDTIASLAPPAESGEKLMPGLVYVLVAAMAGSIVTRRSNILFRAAVPAGFGVAMGWTVLPVTMGNVGELAWRYEQRFPAVAEGHLKTRAAWEKSIVAFREQRKAARATVDEKVKGVRETLEDWVKKGK